MKITKLIKYLEEIQSETPDVDVQINITHSNGTFSHYDIDEIFQWYEAGRVDLQIMSTILDESEYK